MSNSVLEALKRIDTKSTATKWVIPDKNPRPTAPTKEEPVPSEKKELSIQQEKVKEETESQAKLEPSTNTEEELKPSTENNSVSDKLEKVEEEIKSQEKAETEPLTTEEQKPSTEINKTLEENEKQDKSEPTQPQKEEQTKESETKASPPTNTSPKPALTRLKSEPSPDFKKRLEEIHSKPNRPGVLAQHDYDYKEPPEKHASYTKLQKKSTWAGPEPKTFGQKVDWLGETGEFHYYQYKQPERKNYNDYSNKQSNNSSNEGPSERNTGVDKNSVPSKSKFSALLAVYNNGT